MSDQNSCNCCEGLSVEVPIQISNRAGLSAIAYRIGTHPEFKDSLLARISLSNQPALQRLTTRKDDDFTISWLDAWSVVADVLTFYQERIANESYLRTAKERLSILELARMIGYELKPGLAAVAYIAFTLEESSAALGPLIPPNNLTNLLQGIPPVTIDKGIKVQSIPGPGEKPQLFETVESIEGRAEWNTIKPRLTQPQSMDSLNSGLVLLNGTNNNLKKGDPILILGPADASHPNGTKSLETILNILIDNNAKTTRIELAYSPLLPNYNRPTVVYGNFTEFLSPKILIQDTVTKLVSTSWKEADLNVLIRANNWSAREVYQSVNTPPAPPTPPATPEKPPSDPEVYVFRKRVPLFGYNAPKQINYKNGIPNPPTDWDDWTLNETNGIVYLDNAYEEIVKNSQIVIQDSGSNPDPVFYQANSANTTVRTDYGISAKTTQISLNPAIDWGPAGQKLDVIRKKIIFGQNEKLELTELPIDELVADNSIDLDRYYPGLKVGQALILTGERSDLQGVVGSELIILKQVDVLEGFTVLTFTESLLYSYVRTTVTLNANVAMSTHGESVSETLGSGNAGLPFQSFLLKQPPLTFITAATASGVATTLEIRVNDLLWHEVNYFLGHDPEERIYITRQDNDGNTTVTFGDGINGARIPTGQENVKAVYRKGIGSAGLVKANQLSQLLTKPLGVKSAVNPIAANGAQDPEQLEDARSNASLTVLTLERVVSLQDYEDFARAFAGIGKSLASWTWLDGKRHVFLTVAGTNGQGILKTSDLYKNLLAAIRNAGDPYVTLTVDSYSPVFFQVSANLKLDPDFLRDEVMSDVEQNLRNTFSFASRSFGQGVAFSEVIACIQQTNGVIAVDIEHLFRTDIPTNDIQYFLPAALPAMTDDEVFGAELLTLDPRPVDLNIMK
jgi:hypothetical protein